MFDNIGRKIKVLAKVICWIGIIASIIAGIIYWAGIANLYKKSWIDVLIGLLIIVGGSLFSWIGSLTTYAIGEIAENTAAMLGRTKQVPTTNRVAEIRETKKPDQHPSGEAVGLCQMCGKTNVPVKYCKVNDGTWKFSGTLCKECQEKYNATPTDP